MRDYTEQELTIITHCMANMGIALYNSAYYSDAFDVLTLAGALAESLSAKHLNNKAVISHILGMSYTSMDDYFVPEKNSMAIEHFNKAIEAYTQTDSKNILDAYIELGRCYHDTDSETEQRYIVLALEKCAEFYGKGSNEYKEFERLYGKRRSIFPF
jgi:hypothetical protein